MPFTLDCRNCDWAVEEPVELKGEANWLAGRHIAETGHSIELNRLAPDDEGGFDRRGSPGDVVSDGG